MSIGPPSLVLHASQTPLAVLCNAAPFELARQGKTREAIGRAEPENIGARIGQAAHRYAGMLVKGQELPSSEYLAHAYGIEASQISFILHSIRTIWKEQEKWFPNPVVEQKVTPMVLGSCGVTGTPDVHSLVERELRIADFKSGWMDMDHFPQLMTYAMLLLMNPVSPTPEALEWDTAYLVVVRLRYMTSIGIRVTRQEVLDWGKRLTEIIEQGQKLRYTFGSHCNYCDANGQCPAVKNAVALMPVQMMPVESRGSPSRASGSNERVEGQKHDFDFQGQVADFLVSLESEDKLEAGRTLSAVRTVGTILERRKKIFDEMLRAWLITNGPLPVGNDRELKVIEEQRKTIKPLDAWPILSARFDRETLGQAIKITKKPLTDAVARQTKRGQKGKQIEAFLKELEDADAFDEVTILKVKEGKVGEKDITEGE